MDEIECDHCGHMFDIDEVELSFKMPEHISRLTEKQRQKRVKHNQDLFIDNDQRFFVRCCLPLHINELDHDYRIGVWVEVSEQVFSTIYDLWDDENQINEPLLEGEIANIIPLSDNSLGAKVMIQLRGVDTRPDITLLKSNCSLYDEQSNGITDERSIAYSKCHNATDITSASCNF